MALPRRHTRWARCRKPRSRDTVLREHQVEDRADAVLADRRTGTLSQRLAVSVDRVETRKVHQFRLPAYLLDGQSRNQVIEFEVPLADTVVAVPESQ